MVPDFKIEIRNFFDTERRYQKRLAHILHSPAFEQAFHPDLGEFYVMDRDEQTLYRCLIEGEELMTWCSPHETELCRDIPQPTYIYESDDAGQELVLVTGCSSLEARRQRLWLLLHEASFGSGEQVLARRQTCGCFHCGRLFSSEELTEEDFVHERDGRLTTICPYCGVDAVIHEDCGCPVTAPLLQQMHDYFFGGEL